MTIELNELQKLAWRASVYQAFPTTLFAIGVALVTRLQLRTSYVSSLAIGIFIGLGLHLLSTSAHVALISRFDEGGKEAVAFYDGLTFGTTFLIILLLTFFAALLLFSQRLYFAVGLACFLSGGWLLIVYFFVRIPWDRG